MAVRSRQTARWPRVEIPDDRDVIRAAARTDRLPGQKCVRSKQIIIHGRVCAGLILFMRPLMLRGIDLFEVGNTKLLLRHVTRVKDARRRYAHQHTDDGNDNQDLHQRKGALVALRLW